MKGYTYTPPRTRAYEESVALIARSVKTRFDGPVRVDIALSPAGAYVTVETAGESRGKLRGDIDNYAKCVLDGIVKGGMIRDDIDIVGLAVEKVG
jgi:Holliday junction resolvase RusA-like endonuclease